MADGTSLASGAWPDQRLKGGRAQSRADALPAFSSPVLGIMLIQAVGLGQARGYLCKMTVSDIQCQKPSRGSQATIPLSQL